MKKNTLFFSVIVALTCMAVSCAQPAYDSSVLVDDESWHRDSVATFDVPIADTTHSYNLFVNLRNTVDYRYQNLYIFIDILAPNGATMRDTMECFLADNAGRWLGKGRGALRDNRFVYRTGVRFATEGVYRFKLQQAMRVEELKGVSNVGLRVEAAQGD